MLYRVVSAGLAAVLMDALCLGLYFLWTLKKGRLEEEGEEGGGEEGEEKGGEKQRRRRRRRK